MSPTGIEDFLQVQCLIPLGSVRVFDRCRTLLVILVHVQFDVGIVASCRILIFQIASLDDRHFQRSVRHTDSNAIARKESSLDCWNSSK